MIVLGAVGAAAVAARACPCPACQAQGRQAHESACHEPAAARLGGLALDDLPPDVELLARRHGARDDVDGGARITGRGDAGARGRRLDPALEEGEGLRSARRTLVLVVKLLAIQAEPCVV